jgi:hypothetical protein
VDDEGESPSALKRFTALVRRETNASDVRVLPANAEPPTAPNVLSVALGDGHQLLVVFDDTPADRDALARRVEMLARTFAQAVDARPAKARRPPVARSLQDELSALSERARAVDALVIDAHSPIVWGAAIRPPQERSDESAVALVEVSRDDLESVRSPAENEDETDATSPPADRPGGPLAGLSARAADRVREHPAIPQLHKGGRLHSVVREPDLGYVAHSFASIYVLVLVYSEPFDELRAERSVAEALPRIERLVLALPPRDPPPAPMAGVIAFRRRRR